MRHNLITFTAENVIQMQRRLPGNAYQKFKTNAILVAVVEITKVDTSVHVFIDDLYIYMIYCIFITKIYLIKLRY